MLQYEKARGEMNKIERSPLQKVFKYICLVLLAMLLYCIPGFIAFKQTAKQQGFYFVSPRAWYQCIAGFLVFGIIKQSYYYLFTKHMGFVVKSKFEGDQKMYRLKSIAKQSFDTIYYLSTSVTGYYLFRKQPWFPKQAGGQGSCYKIFEEYPNWPTTGIIPQLEWFYMLQLGKFLYSITESVVFRRADRKFYEFLLHHFVATTLILFSMLTNGVAIGALIMVIHDVSDLPAALLRGFIDTKYDNAPTSLTLFALFLGSWAYFRVVVFPFCIIDQIIDYYPNPSQIWWSIRLQYGYMGLLCSVLVCMHIFWIILLIKYGWDYAFNQKSKKEEKAQ